jgi:hypothetical protein
MSETPQTHSPASDVPQQTRGQERATAPQTPPQHRGEAPPTRATAAAGWAVFAAIMLVMVGAFQAIIGLTALLNSGYYVVGENGLLVNVDFTAWGWAHIALGAIAVAAGFGLLAGQAWARVVGMALALLSAVVSLGFIAAYPLWSLMVIALDVLVIYAISMHGTELKNDS